MGMKRFLCILILAAVLIGCSDEIESPSESLPLPPRPETPRGLTAAIGDQQVVLSWSVGDPGTVDRYKIYFSDTATTDMSVIDSTVFTVDTVDGLANGRQYFFRVAAVDTSGLEGTKSSAIAAVPGIFSIDIEDGSEYTNSRTVSIALTAPQGTSLVQLSEDDTFASAHWESYASSKTFELTDGDGVKTVYARFQLDAGGNSVGRVFDDIELDRGAVIDSVLVTDISRNPLTPGQVLHGGEVVHFMLYTSEDGQNASVDITDLGAENLNDLGINGDQTAADGIFETDYDIPDETELRNALVTGRFTDAAGNVAPEKSAAYRLNVTSPPDTLALWGYALSSLEIELSWTRAELEDFSRYRLFRFTDTLNFSDSLPVKQITNAIENKYTDGDLDDSTRYGYFLYIDDLHGNTVRSKPVFIWTLKNSSPDTLTIAVNFTGDSLTAKVSWSKASDADDFEAYHIVRSDVSFPGEPYDESRVIDFITNQQTTTYTDRSIPDTGTYYYRVYVFDKQGLRSFSNEASVFIPR